MKKGKPIPQMVCDRAKRLYEVYPEEAVLRLVGISSASLSRIRSRGWKAFPAGFRHRPRPSDFAIQARHMTSEGLARHYRAANATVARWKRELRG